MTTVRGEIVIDRRPEEVFDFVADEENEPRYNPQMKAVKKVTEDPSALERSSASSWTAKKTTR